MIQMARNNGTMYPILVCDFCGKRIDDAGIAAAVMPESKPYPNGNGRVLFVHKGACHNAVEKTEGHAGGWEELSRHLRLLLHNVKLPPTQLADEMEKDKQFGCTNE
jgi:hypothetical protein